MNGLGARLIIVVFCPFAAGFFLSFLFRNVTAVIAKDLAGTFALTSSELGLLTSAYFLSFAAMQVPVGIFLDRYGPRRVVAGLLLVAGLGSSMFAMADSMLTLALARALVGVGVSACLMGSMKAFTLWFPLERMSSLNGMMIAAGGLGGLAATTPIEYGAAAWGWRSMFWLLGALCVASAAYIALVVPEKRLPGAGESWREAFRRMGTLFCIPLFWRVGLPMMTVHGTFQALIGLWLAPWLIDVVGLPRGEAANWLFAAVFSYTLGSIVFGVGADHLAARGIARLSLLKWGTAAAIAALFGLAAVPAQGKFPLLLAYTFMVIAPVLSYVLLTRHFAPELSGRVNTALNVAMFVVSFSAQWGVGAILRFYPAEGSRYAAEGYAVAFGVLAAFHLAAWLWLAVLEREPEPYRA